MSILSALWESMKPTLCVMGFGFSVMTAVELLTPRERQSLRGRLPGLLFWALWLAVSGIAYAGFRVLWTAIGIPPLLTLPTGAGWGGPVAWVVAPIVGAAIYDFFFYWCHRAQHRWLWRYHAVHHSIRELSAVNAYHHPIEPFVQILLIAIPTSLIASEAGPVVPTMLVLLHLQAAFIHSPSRWHLGPLARLIVDNRFHRIHHSVELRHFDRNFGAFTTLWDRLFGTAWMPDRNDWPTVGIAEVDQPRTLHQWITLPVAYDRAVATDTRSPDPIDRI